MYTKQNIIMTTLIDEGGYVNNPNDSGGPTRYGVTSVIAKEHIDLWSKYSFNGDMQYLPKELAYEIIEREFWNRLRLDDILEISGEIAALLFEWMVNSGAHEPGKAIQEHLNASNRGGVDYDDILADGIVGSTTIRTLKAYVAKRGHIGKATLLQYLNASQIVDFRELTVKREKDEAFYNGWLARSHERMCKFMDTLA